MTGEDLQRLAVAWYYLEQFGFGKAPPQTDPEVVRNMALALVTAAAGDGKLSDEERTWIRGYFATKGYPAEVVGELQLISPPDPAGVAELMKLGILARSGRILVYDAVRAASSDGYDPGERQAVRSVAAALGIDEATVAEIERLVEEETALRERRIRLLMPDGHPNLAAKLQPTR